MTMYPRRSPTVFDPNADIAINLVPSQDQPEAVGRGFMGDTLAAAFRQENVVGSLMARQWESNDPVEGYAAWDDIKGTKYEELWDRFTVSNNPGYTATLKRQIDMEEEDRRTLAAAGGWGMLASIGAGIFSPENLLPGGTIVRGVRIGSAVGRTAMSTASAAAIAVAGAEGVLHGSQELRTPLESAFNIGGAAVLGGTLGAGLSAAFSKAEWVRLGKAVEKELAAGADPVALAKAEVEMLSGMGSDVGAAARTVETLDDNTIAGRGAQIAGGAVKFLNPVLRVLHSPSRATRGIGTGLFENPVYLKKNLSGVASAPAVETLVKQYTQGAMARAVADANKLYGDYRKGGGALNREQWNQAIGRAMRRNDEDADPSIAAGAKAWRAAVFDPLKEKAIEAGLLPKDVSVDTALSYFTRVYNRPMIEAREAEFKAIVKRYIDREVRNAESRAAMAKLDPNVRGTPASDENAPRQKAPPPAPGMIRYYHGTKFADASGFTGKTFVAATEDYARNYRGGPNNVLYVDLTKAEAIRRGLYDEVNDYPINGSIDDGAAILKSLDSPAPAPTAAKKMATPSKEPVDFLNDKDRAAYVDQITDDIFNTITGRNVDGDIPRDIVAATRGPLKERTFHIRDEEIEEFLESNVEAVGRRYARTMAADIELTQAFGKADLKEQISQIRADYQRLREAVQKNVDPETGAELKKPLDKAAKEKAIKRLVDAEKHDIRDIEALRDMIRGTYMARENSTNFARAARVAGTVNYIRLLGGVTLTSLTEVARHFMVHGLSGVMLDGLVPLMRNLKGFKMSVEEGKIAGAVTERLLNTRMATWADINDPYSVGSPFERFMDNTAAGFSRLNGLVYWTDFQNAFASVVTQNRVLRGAGNYAGLGKREKAYLAFLGIDEGMAARIQRQFDQHGSVESGGIRVAHTDDWTDEVARRTYRAAINKDVDSIVVKKGIGDVPLFAHTPTGRLLLQFKGFAMASHQRALMRGLQERPMGFVSGAMTATTIGMLVYYLKSIEANRTEDISDNPGRWIAEGLDRSGLFTVAFEANNTIEKAFGIGAYGALAKLFPGSDQDGKASRYASRGFVEGLLGPTAALIDNAWKAGNAIKGEGGWSEGEIRNLYRLAPGATLPGIRSLVEYVGVPAAVDALN